MRLDVPSTISGWFHEKHFQHVDLNKGFESENEILSREEFFSRLVLSCFRSSENNIQFLVGNIGDGKTTYMCNLIYQNWKLFAKAGVIPVRFNIDTLSEHTVPNVSDVARLFYNQLFQSLRVNEILKLVEVDRLKNISAIKDDDNAERILAKLALAIKSIQDLKRKTLLLIIDNIDFLYHLGDRGAFSENSHNDQRFAYEAIIRLIQIFSRDDQSCANLGLNLLYCLRYDTLEYLNSKREEVPI